MDALILELKKEIIEVLNLEEVKPEDIDENAPLFGEGLGLDSIDALELIVLMEKNYGIKFKTDSTRYEILFHRRAERGTQRINFYKKKPPAGAR